MIIIDVLRLLLHFGCTIITAYTVYLSTDRTTPKGYRRSAIPRGWCFGEMLRREKRVPGSGDVNRGALMIGSAFELLGVMFSWDPSKKLIISLTPWPLQGDLPLCCSNLEDRRLCEMTQCHNDFDQLLGGALRLSWSPCCFLVYEVSEQLKDNGRQVWLAVTRTIGRKKSSLPKVQRCHNAIPFYSIHRHLLYIYFSLTYRWAQDLLILNQFEVKYCKIKALNGTDDVQNMITIVFFFNMMVQDK